VKRLGRETGLPAVRFPRIPLQSKCWRPHLGWAYLRTTLQDVSRGRVVAFPAWQQDYRNRRDGARVRCFTRNGHDRADRFRAIVDAASRIQASSFLIDGEAVIAHDDGTPDFHALRSRSRGNEAVLFAFDLIEHDGDDLRDLPLIERKRRLKKLLGRAKRRAIRFNEHLTGDGPTVFEHACRMGLEGIVSKRTDAPYRSGPSKTWLKSKNPASEAVRREREEEWR
jgi:bifunctional non-homologous end joining protein LigD